MKEGTVTRPAALAADTIARLEAHADPDRAASYQRYFKEPVAWFGVENGTVKQIKTEVITRIQDVWTLDDAVEYCEAMIEDPHLEARGIGFQVVGQMVNEASVETLSLARGWLENACGNWGLVDNLAQSVVAPIVEQYPECIKELFSWTDESSLWVRRGAAVALVPLVRDAVFRAAAYDVVDRLAVADEDLIHKAIGWLLREAGKSDVETLREYLLANGPKLPRTTVRYAIERFPSSERKELLQATRTKTKGGGTKRG